MTLMNARNLLIGVWLLCLLAMSACEDAEYVPCEGLDCGQECQLCDPADPDCVETEVIKRCTTGGTCSAGPTTCPQDGVPEP